VLIRVAAYVMPAKIVRVQSINVRNSIENVVSLVVNGG
jgi:hypothetical protein